MSRVRSTTFITSLKAFFFVFFVVIRNINTSIDKYTYKYIIKMTAPVGWDKGQTYHAGLHPTRIEKDSRTSLELKFLNFLDQYRVEELFVYR